MLALLHCDLEDFLGVFTLFDKYQEFYQKDAAIAVFDYMFCHNELNFHSASFYFMCEVLKAVGSRHGFKFDVEIISSDDKFRLDCYDKSSFRSDATYYQVRDELRYFEELFYDYLTKKEKKYRASPKSLEKSQFYLTVLLGCNLDVLTGMFELFDRCKEFYGVSIDIQVCEGLLAEDDLDSIVFNFMLRVLNKVCEKYEVKIDPFIIEDEKFNSEKYLQEFYFSSDPKYLQIVKELKFFEGLINKNYVKKLERYKIENTIHLQLFGEAFPIVSDFQYEDSIKLIKDKTQVVVKKERILLRFQFPLMYWVVFKYEKKGGFTRLDLFECIYEGYKKALAEEGSDRLCKLDDILVKGVFYNSPMNLYDVIVESKF